jgi:MOSC domain-containing protein YiiM
MPETQVGRVLAIALKPGPREPMKSVQRATAIEGGGLEGDIGDGAKSCIHLLASRHWQETVRSLGTVLLWQTSFANVLVEADTLANLVGKTVRLGGATLQVTSVAHPHPGLDEIRPGLCQILRDSGRAGVLGHAVRGGLFSVGDALISQA